MRQGFQKIVKWDMDFSEKAKGQRDDFLNLTGWYCHFLGSTCHTFCVGNISNILFTNQNIDLKKNICVLDLQPLLNAIGSIFNITLRLSENSHLDLVFSSRNMCFSIKITFGY